VIVFTNRKLPKFNDFDIDLEKFGQIFARLGKISPIVVVFLGTVTFSVFLV